MNDMRSGGSNRKLMVGLVLVIGSGLVVLALANGTNLLSFLPFLLILACPLMMIFMMGSMGHNHMSGMSSDEQHSAAPGDLPDLSGLPRDRQVWALRRELTRMAWQQEALRHDLEQLEAEQKADRIVDAERTATTQTSQTTH